MFITWTQDKLNQIKDFLQKGVVPPLPRSSYFKFKARFGNGDYKIEGNELLYLGKRIVPVEKKKALLEALYKDPLYFQASVPRFYKRVSTEYANISMSDVSLVLENKRVVQLFKRTVPVEVTPIQSKGPRKIFLHRFRRFWQPIQIREFRE